MNKIYNVFAENKRSLLLIYVFMLLTELSILSQPFLLGKSIDGLMSGTYGWLILLGLSYASANLFNYKRMVFDTGVYTRIYNSIVFRFFKESDADHSTRIARSDMAHEIVNVLEGYVHYYIATAVTVVGTIGFIWTKNHWVGVVLSSAIFFILGGVLLFYKKIRQSIRIRNNHYEEKINAIQDGYSRSVSFFSRQRRLAIYESTLQGKNWLLAGALKNLFLITAIVLLTRTTEGITVGGVITIYSYSHDFLVALMSVPVGMEMYSRLNDVLKRL